MTDFTTSKNVVFPRRLSGLRRAGSVAIALLLCAVLSPAQAFTSKNADKMLESFLAAFLIREGNNAYFRVSSDSDEKDGFWTFAEMIEMVEDCYDRTESESTRRTVETLVNGFIAKNGTDWSWNEYNDDIMWAVSALLRASEITGIQNFKTIARANFDMSYARGWNLDGNGGMRWRQGGTSKNAIAQSTAAIAAFRLFKATGEKSYRDKAWEIYTWQKTNQVYSNGHVRDNPPSNNDPTTYNQGTFIGIANYLGDIEWATKAMDYLKTMGSTIPTSGGERILIDYPETGDLAGFNGIALRWAAKFMIERKLESKYLTWLRANANQAYRVRNSAGLTWSKFKQQTPDTALGSWGCSNAVVALNVVPNEDLSPDLVTVKSPNKPRSSTKRGKVLIKGKADSSVQKVYLRNKRVSKKKLFKARGTKSWKARLKLKDGLNKVEVLVDMGDGKKPQVLHVIKIFRK